MHPPGSSSCGHMRNVLIQRFLSSAQLKPALLCRRVNKISVLQSSCEVQSCRWCCSCLKLLFPSSNPPHKCTEHMFSFQMPSRPHKAYYTRPVPYFSPAVASSLCEMHCPPIPHRHSSAAKGRLGLQSKTLLTSLPDLPGSAKLSQQRPGLTFTPYLYLRSPGQLCLGNFGFLLCLGSSFRRTLVSTLQTLVF